MPAPARRDPAAPEPAIRLRGLRKVYGGGTDAVRAVDGVDLDIPRGEFFSLLGPSGSGKTTVLRLIAGFELPTEGTVELAGHDVSRRPPFERDVNTVFQDYALFPHMTVRQNVEYGPRARGVPAAERRRRALDALASVHLDQQADRRPHQLSGGQRQRVALARALVNRPSVLLLDEPLGALDLTLRLAMQSELKDLQREVGVTFVFVTHDQHEALSMSDRIAVFQAGRIEQVGPPREVYERPASAFVAGFVGTSNLLSGPAAASVFGREGSWSVRPEHIRLAAESEATGSETGASGLLTAVGQVTDVVYTGAHLRHQVVLDAGARLTVETPSGAPGPTPAPGRRVRLSWPAEHAVALPDPEPVPPEREGPS